jgi:predicted nucleic acid-binding protein
VEVVVSEGILEQYQDVGRRLGREFPGVDARPFLELLWVAAKVYRAPSLPAPVCEHADDDKFLACALASETKVIVSGDRALQRVSRYRGIEVLSPRRFVETHLQLE